MQTSHVASDVSMKSEADSTNQRVSLIPKKITAVASISCTSICHRQQPIIDFSASVRN